jgi:hypothetical protein
MRDPFVGTWKLNPGRSKFDPNHRPTEATMAWELRADGSYHMRASGVSEKGERVHRTAADADPRRPSVSRT